MRVQDKHKEKLSLIEGCRQLDYPLANNFHSNLPIIQVLAEKLKEFYPVTEELNLICRGSSGAIVASIVAMQFPNAHIIHIKKEGEICHGQKVPFTQNYLPAVFVDDFIDQGRTMLQCFEDLNEAGCQSYFDVILTTTKWGWMDMVLGNGALQPILKNTKHITYCND